MSFNLGDYEPVADRLARFWADHPHGRIHTAIDRMVDGAVIMRAEVYRDADDTRPAATGYAEEIRTERGVNSTSHVENCETSAVGRALANLNYAPKGARPSREEMSKQRREVPTPEQVAAKARTAIKSAKTVDELQNLLDRLDERFKDGLLVEDDYNALAELIEHRRGEMRNVDPPQVADQRQHKRMAVLWREVGLSGDDKRDQRLARTSAIVGRDIASSKDLTHAEAVQVIKSLVAEVDDKPQPLVGAS